MFNYPDDDVSRARLFAIERHAGQVRKYTGVPYTTHLAEVVVILKSFGYCGPTMLATAWLHDTVEDTNTTLDEIHDHFGVRVCQAVNYLSDLTPKELGNRAFRKAKYAHFLESAPPWVKNVKVADLISNTRSIKVLDPGFAPVYLEEKRHLLQYPLRNADERMWWTAWGLAQG